MQRRTTTTPLAHDLQVKPGEACMSIGFSVRFWGVRGSIATGGREFAGVGGNTTCVEVRIGEEIIVLDAGTGVFPLGQTLVSPLRATFLFSHFHWDHIQGFPLFRPAYEPENELTLYGYGDSAADVEAVFAQQMQAPHFPVGLGTLRAQLAFRALHAGSALDIGPAHVRTAALNHPQGCLGYRISVDDRSVVFVTDTEPRQPGAADPAVVEFARGADLLIHDAQYTEQEYDGRSGCPRHGWGHSTYDVACRTARAAGVQQLALFHHDPAHDDHFIERILSAARGQFLNAVVAREGMTLDIRARASASPKPAGSRVSSVEARRRRAA